MKLKCLVFLSFLAASQAASVRHRQREIPVQVVYEEAPVDGAPLKTVIQRDVANVEDVKKIPDIVESAIQENTVAGEESVEQENSIKYFSRVKNLDAKVQLSPEEQVQSIKHLPFSEPAVLQPEIAVKSVAEISDVKSIPEPVEAAPQKAEQLPEAKPLDEAKPLKEAKPLEETKSLAEAKPSEKDKLPEEIKPIESEIASTTSRSELDKEEEEEDEDDEEEENAEGQKGEEESSENVPTDLTSILDRAQEIISSGLQELRERFKEADNKQESEAWTYLEKNVEQLFITEKEKANIGQARQAPIFQSPPDQAIVDEVAKESVKSVVNPEENKADQAEVPVQDEVPAQVAVAEPQKPVESEKQNQPSNQNQNQNQNVIQNIINGFQNITNTFIQNFQQSGGGNGTQNEGQQGGGIGGGFVSYFTGGIQQIINNINNLGGGGGGQPAGNGTQADTGATTQRPNLVSNFVNSFQQFIRPPGAPQGNQSDTGTGGNNQQQGPGGFFQGAINQFGQAVNNIFQGNRPPGQQGDTGATQAPLPGPIQAFQNISNQIISNFNQFNPFAPSTQPPATSGDDPSTQRPNFVQNVGQVIQGLNPFRPQQEGSAPSNPIVAGIQNATNQFQQVVSGGNPVENIQNAITGVQGGGGNPIQSIQNTLTGQTGTKPSEDAAGDGNRNQVADAAQNAIPSQDGNANQNSNANQNAGQALRTSGLVENEGKVPEEVAPLQAEPQQEKKKEEGVEEKKQEAEQAQEVMQAVE